MNFVQDILQQYLNQNEEPSYLLTFNIHGVRMQIYSNIPDVCIHFYENLQFFLDCSSDSPRIRYDVYLLDGDAIERLARMLPDAKLVDRGPRTDRFTAGTIRIIRFRVPAPAIIVSDVASDQGVAFINLSRGFKKFYFDEFCYKIMAHLNKMLNKHGLFPIHASAVANRANALIFCGPSGRGKTTIALTFVCRGYSFLADDRPFLCKRNGQLQILAHPQKIGALDDIRSHIPEIRGQMDAMIAYEERMSRSRRLKTFFRVSQLIPEDMLATSAIPKAVFFLEAERSDSTPQIYRIEPVESYRRMIRNVGPFLSDRLYCNEYMAIFDTLVKSVPCYSLISSNSIHSTIEAVVSTVA